MNYSQKEIDLAVDYLRGEINEIQLNYLSIQNNIDSNKIKKIAEDIVVFSNFVKNLGIVLTATIVFFYVRFILNLIYNL